MRQFLWVMVCTLGLCNLGYAHAQLGNQAFARGFYQRVLEHNPQNDVARSALEQLKDKAHA